MGRARRSTVPPELRAIARAVADIDASQLPTLAGDNKDATQESPALEVLRRLTTELHDEVPLTASEFELFRTAYADCRRQLHSVRRGVLEAGTVVTSVLVLSSRMDALCTTMGLSLVTLLPHVALVHAYLLELCDRHVGMGGEEPHFQSIVLQRLIGSLQRTLEVVDAALQVFEMEDGLTTATPRSHHTSTGERGHSPELPNDEVSTYTATADSAALVGDDAGPVNSSSGVPPSLADTCAAADADLLVLFTHLRWYITVSAPGDHRFDATIFFTEAAARAGWASRIGRHRPVCTLEAFDSFLTYYSAGARTLLREVLNVAGSGVVTAYAVRRLLQIWAPLRLLEANLRQDLATGAVDLSRPFPYLAATLATRPDARAGDYVIGLSEEGGDIGGAEEEGGSLKVAVLRHSRGFRWQLWADPPPKSKSSNGKANTSDTHSARDSGAAPLVTATYTLCHDTGAWTVRGLTREAFESIAAACASLPEVFQRPRGLLPSPRPPLPLDVAHSEVNEAHHGTFLAQREGRAAVGSAMVEESGSVSALHRACFHNNAAYVRTLLGRGAGLLVNSPVADPRVNLDFCWTPLLCAVNNPHGDPVKVVELLLEAGAEVTFQDEAQCTALYYAVTNGYADAAGTLLRHTPNLMTSPYTVPLLVAVGAHAAHMRAMDVRRLVDVIPSAAMLTVIAPYESSLGIVTLATDLVAAKLQSVSHPVSEEERHLVEQQCAARSTDQPTALAEKEVLAWSQQHTIACLRSRLEVTAALKVLCARSYLLSWRLWLEDSSAAAVAQTDRQGWGDPAPVVATPVAAEVLGNGVIDLTRGEAGVRSLRVWRTPARDALEEGMDRRNEVRDVLDYVI